MFSIGDVGVLLLILLRWVISKRGLIRWSFKLELEQEIPADTRALPIRACKRNARRLGTSSNHTMVDRSEEQLETVEGRMSLGRKTSGSARNGRNRQHGQDWSGPWPSRARNDSRRAASAHDGYVAIWPAWNLDGRG